MDIRTGSIVVTKKAIKYVGLPLITAESRSPGFDSQPVHFFSIRYPWSKFRLCRKSHENSSNVVGYEPTKHFCIDHRHFVRLDSTSKKPF